MKRDDSTPGGAENPPADYIDRELTRLLRRISEDPGDIRRLLQGLARALELGAERIPAAEEGDRVLVWRSEDDARRNK